MSHGRFLIELLQNAADAWDTGTDGGERSRVEIVIAETPVLLVANEGQSFPASVVLKSLGHIGRSMRTSRRGVKRAAEPVAGAASLGCERGHGRELRSAAGPRARAALASGRG